MYWIALTKAGYERYSRGENGLVLHGDRMFYVHEKLGANSFLSLSFSKVLSSFALTGWHEILCHKFCLKLVATAYRPHADRIEQVLNCSVKK